MLSRQMMSIFGFRSNSRKFHFSKLLYKATVIDGKGIALEIERELKVSVDSWIKSGKRRPKLVALLVGNDQASKTYVNNKVKAAKSIGIDSETILCSERITQSELIGKIETLNGNPSVDGILVQLPLPKGLDEREVCHAIAPFKDVDGFHVDNIGKLSLGSKGIIPATALAVRELITRTSIETRGKNAVVVGRSKHVGLPIALLLHADSAGETKALDMTTTICHRFTPHVQLEKFTRLADVIVVAAGIPGLLTKEMVKPGACVIDVGITRVKDMQGNFKLVGDVDFDEVKDIAGYITPVPGGVGPMTVVMLMRNTLLAAKNGQSDE